MVNRAERRALTRLARPKRAVLNRLTAQLRRLPAAERQDVLEQLDPWDRSWLEDRL